MKQLRQTVLIRSAPIVAPGLRPHFALARFLQREWRFRKIVGCVKINGQTGKAKIVPSPAGPQNVALKHPFGENAFAKN